jgi:hypothetical protein
MLNDDFKEFAALLRSSGAEYLIVGGYALAAYGHPRYTGDLDFWVGSQPENARRVLNALEAFGFGGLGLSLADLTRAEQVVQLGYPPRRIDLLTSIDGVEFEPCYRRRHEVWVDGVLLSFISLDDLRRNKRAAGRPQDLADLDALDGPDEVQDDPDRPRRS